MGQREIQPDKGVMSKEEMSDLFERIDIGLRRSYEKLLKYKAALGLDIVTADENGMPLTVPAKQVLAEYLKGKGLQATDDAARQ